jgi:predicted deacylase
MLESFVYKGSISGPRLLVLGAIHGNEKCGTIAIRCVIDEIEKGSLKIAKGQLTFVPICNPRAYEKDVRFTERNLNRYLVPTAKPTTYEAELGNELCPLIAACDVLLDIHSYTVGGAPFVFIAGAGKKEIDYAASLGAATLITGWEDAYAKTGRCQNKADKEEGIGTTEYARRFGALGVTIECGQHKAKEAPEIAYNAIHNALAFLGMAENASPPVPAATQLVTVTHVYYRDDTGEMTKTWKHLEPVKSGEVFAHRANGDAIRAPADGFMIMPRADCPIGEEWFYFGVGRAL